MKAKYAILCGSRSGSTLLCDYLKSTNRAGDPQEFFNKELIPKFQKLDTKGKGYNDGIINGTKTENDVFGVKVVGFDQLKAFIDSGIQITHYIWLKRENTVAQAVSRYKSWKKNLWHTNKPIDVPYSFKDIKWCYDEILQENAALEKYFELLDHIKISYEKDLLSNKDQTIRCILEYMRINSHELPELKTGRIKISNYSSRQMEKRFKKELLYNHNR